MSEIQQGTNDCDLKKLPLTWRRRVEIRPSGCWEWTGARKANGYGTFRLAGRYLTAHRVIYQTLVKELPDDLVLDHLCRNRVCVNPNHLEPVTHRVNILRGVGLPAQNARKTHCKRGHPLSGDNLSISPKGARICRECKTISNRSYESRRPKKIRIRRRTA